VRGDAQGGAHQDKAVVVARVCRDGLVRGQLFAAPNVENFQRVCHPVQLQQPPRQSRELAARHTLEGTAAVPCEVCGMSAQRTLQGAPPHPYGLQSIATGHICALPTQPQPRCSCGTCAKRATKLCG
jgi:hypothetical protein